MKKLIIRLLLVLSLLYFILGGLLYFFQEKLIFLPVKLDKNFQYSFPIRFEELNFEMADKKKLNGILFTTQSPKGLIFYLHGNAGNLNSWGNMAETYTQLGYDVLFLDYRGYGKSEGSIQNENQIFTDNQLVYNTMLKRYPENKIVIIGYSIGTGLAAHLASQNSPKMLILKAPYYSLTHLVNQKFPMIPSFILKYNLATNEFLKNCNMNVILFHGDQDELINHKSSILLQKELKNKITLITLYGQGHNGINENIKYKQAIEKILNN